MTRSNKGILFQAPSTPCIRVNGEQDTYPVHRIFCVGRNYAEHAKEMGVEVDREAPFYFTKPATAIVESGEKIPYPPGTEDYHYEMELVVAIGKALFKATPVESEEAIFGYAAGLDMTRRDLQLAARSKGRPWDLGKAFEQSAVIAQITKSSDYAALGPQRIRLSVGGEMKQDAKLSDLIWSVPELLSYLSRYYHLAAGDLVFTGTPAGVGPVLPGDDIVGEIDGLDPVRLLIGPSE